MQTPILEDINTETLNLNDDNQIIQFEPDPDIIQMHDLNASCTVALGITPDNLTSVFAQEPAVKRKNPARHYFKWTFHEINQLHREAQIMDLTIQEIATRHQRTNSSILFKLLEEKLIMWNSALDNTSMRAVLEYYNNYLRHYHEIEDENEEDDEEEEDEDEDEEEDYVPSTDYEDDEEDDHCVINVPLFPFKMDELTKFDKMLLTHGYRIYCAFVFSTIICINIYYIFFRY